MKQEPTYAQPPQQYDPNSQQYDPNQQPQAYYNPQQQYDPNQQQPQTYYNQPPQQGYPQQYPPQQGYPQPQYYTAQPVIVAQPATTTTTTVINTGGVVAVSGEAKRAEEAFMFALLISFVLRFFGIGFCFSCFLFLPVMKFRSSSDARARQYGQYGQLGFFITMGLNVVIVVCIALPIIIAIIATSVARASIR